MTSQMSEVASDGSVGAAVAPLKRTMPWVKFIAILNFIAVAFMLLGSIPMIFMSSVSAASELPAGVGNIMRFGGLAYLIMALLYVLPGVLAWRYAQAIERFTRTVETAQLVSALDAQRRIWKFWSILLIVGFALGIVAVIITVVAAGAGGFGVKLPA